MASLVSDPKTLTIAQLRQHLQRYNVPIPPTTSKTGTTKTTRTRKADYVDLYTRHLLKDRLEFSSDEEGLSLEKDRTEKPIEKVKKSRTKKQVKKKMSGDAIDVMELTDEELSQKLRELGADVGPILDTTRRVYQKKLARLLAGEVYEPPVITDSQDEYSDEDVADGAEQQKTPVEAETRSDVRELRKRPMPAYTKATTVTASVEESRTISNSMERDEINNQPALKTEQKVKQSGISKWVQFGILIVIGAIIFLIFQNLEPAGKNPFQHITG